MKLLSTKQAYSKAFKTFKLTEEWNKIFGDPERSGGWIIYAKDKHGKTTLALLIANLLSGHEKVLYMSAEEGISKNLIETSQRVGIKDGDKKIKWLGYTSYEELTVHLEKRTCPKVVIIDNWTVYNDEMTKKDVLDLQEKYKNKLFIFLAHEDRKEPDGAKAKLWKKLSQIIIRVEGLKAFVSGRCPGGTITINEEKSQIYWGTEITQP